MLIAAARHPYALAAQAVITCRPTW